MLNNPQSNEKCDINTIISVNPTYYKGELTVCGDDWHYDRLSLGYDKFYFIVDGKCPITVNGITYSAEPYRLFLLPCKSVQSFGTYSGKPIKKYWFHCTLPCDDKDITEILKLPVFIDVDRVDYVKELFSDIIKCESISTLASKIKQKSDILKLLSYYLSNCEAGNKRVSYDERISRVLNYIDEHLREEITLNVLCEQVHLQASYLIRLFKDATGETPFSYIRKRRINLAQKLLLDKTLSVEEVSSASGFHDVHYFSKTFKSQTAMTPTAYRRMATAKHIN